MEIVGESLFEVDCKSFVQEVEEGVNKRGRDGDKTEVEDSLDKDSLALFDN
jgi:hypothetical protein